MIAARVPHRTGPFVVFHLLDAVEAHPSRLESAVVRPVHIPHVEVDLCGHRLPLGGGSARLDDASLDAKGGVDDFSSRVFPTLLFHFLRPKSTLDERDELVRGHLATAEHYAPCSCSGCRLLQLRT